MAEAGSQPIPVLLILEDPAIRRLLAAILAEAGFLIREPADEGNEAVSAALAGVRLAIIDRGPADAEPPGDRRLIDLACPVPIVALTRREDSRPPAGVAGQVRLVEAPLRPDLLVAAATDLTRDDGGILAIGPCRLFTAAKMLIDAGGRQVRLTEKETRILERLVRSPGRVVPRETLLRDVFGYGAVVATHTIETHIYRLRRKLAAAMAGGSDLIRARDGGYCLAPA